MDQGESFAPAVMMRLVAAGLKRQGIEIDQTKPVGAHVPRRDKLGLLQQLETAHGPDAVLALSDAVPDMPDEPVAVALRRATGLRDLLERWRRVEAFSHGAHRVHWELTQADTVHLRHVCRSGTALPARAESLLVLGVITRLAELICGQPVSVWLSDGQPLRRNGVWQRAKLEPWDRALTLKQSAAAVCQTPVASRADGVFDRCRAFLLDDPVRRWTLHDMAGMAGVSVRTLQRRLAEHGVTFSELIAQTRLEKAGAYLCDPGGPGLSETGFLSGYTDQAHFSRSFKRHVGTTPSDYRNSFAA